MLNGDETGVDCGGACAALPTAQECSDGLTCAIDADCQSNVCLAEVCIPETCANGVKDGLETEVDCGGSVCPACAAGVSCQTGADCQSGVCSASVCQPPTCSDGVRNQAESDVDCGDPSCPLCALGEACVDDTDCQSGACLSDACSPATCTNGSTDGGESDVDCGGPCPPCAVGECDTGDDCVSGVCILESCAAPSCSDGVQNGEETGPDCGALACDNACDAGLGCDTDWDCLTRVCDPNTKTCLAPTCDDLRQNGDETAVDCGGLACDPCIVGQSCTSGSDCESLVCGAPGPTQCLAGSPCCQAPSCDPPDGQQNGDEMGIDCGGDGCPSCPAGYPCEVNTDCTSGVCAPSDAYMVCLLGSPCCHPPRCGDHLVNQASEACDDGNNQDCIGDGALNCAADCTRELDGCGDGVLCAMPCDSTYVAPYCGEVCDGALVGSASCDDFSFAGGTLLCSSTCDDYSLVACQGGCGNGRIEVGEVCDGSALGGAACMDFGFDGGTLSCNASCNDFALTGCTGYCGDSNKDADEQCDPGDALAGAPADLDGATCASVSSSLSGTGLACSAVCTYDTSACSGCGNDRIEDAEQCDGTDLGGEDCHSANPIYDAGVLQCSASCAFDFDSCTNCGNSIIEPGELCDGDTVTVSCAAIGPFTGGQLTCGSTCTSYDTSLCTACGDNIAQPAEACDGADLKGLTCQDVEVSPGVTYDGGVLACNTSCSELVTTGCLSCGSCSEGAVCVDGQCVCPQFTELCDLGGGTYACVDTRSDVEHCGDCSTMCVDAACVGGLCSASACILPEVYVATEQRCVNTTIDNDCCGTSCIDCPADQVCHKGACLAPLVTYTEAARCATGGPAISLSTGGANDCAANLAQVTFRWAVCACSTLTLNAAMTTDSFDSTLQPYLLTDSAARLGAGIGANVSIAGNGIITCSGTLWSGGTLSKLSGQTYVKQEIHVDDELELAGGSLGDVAVSGSGNLYSDGPVAGGGMSVVGDVYQSPAYFDESCTATSCNVLGLSGLTVDRYHNVPQTVGDACDCESSQLVPVSAIIDAHACAPEGTAGCTGADCCDNSNHNRELGLDPNLLASGAGGRLDLPCGHYYLRGVSVSAVTLYAHGNTALYIDGDFQPDKFEISLAPTAQFDIFIKGGFCNANQSNLGTPSYPAQLRVYVGGSGSPCTPSAVYSVDIKGASRVAGNVYGPWGGFKFGAHAESYGGIFTNSFQADASTLLHYDRGVVHVGDDTCPPPCGNGELDNAEVCDGANLAGQSCSTLGFDGGALLCRDDCAAFRTDFCYRCGDGVVELPERCEPGVTPLSESCQSLGFEAGSLQCSPSCIFDTSLCRSCGNGSLDLGETCDGTLLGGLTCVLLGQDGGTLGCAADCLGYDMSGCYGCGDGTLNSGEQCDGGVGATTCDDLGYTGGTLACRADCTFDASGCYLCGDYVRQNPPEQCDGLALGGATCSTINSDFDGGLLACSSSCLYDTSGCTDCGDDLREGLERCDGDDLGGKTCLSLGFEGGTLSCTASCAFDTSGCGEPFTCGNGQFDANEECDSSATDPLGGVDCVALGYSGGTLACSLDCTFDTSLCAYCGDGIKTANEQCDGLDLGVPAATCAFFGLEIGTPTCRSDCLLAPGTCAACGDGVIQSSEACDAAGVGAVDDVFAPGVSCLTAGFDGGTLACVAAGEPNECTLVTDGCYGCGDGVLDGAWENCEPPSIADPDGDLGVESCATLVPDTVGALACYANCTYDTSGCDTCGNGSIDLGEQCDGSDLGGESCTSLGLYGIALACYPPGHPSECQLDTSGCTSCGNGVREGAEICDGDDLGGETCVSEGFKDGVLACAADCLSFDTSQCVMCFSCRDCGNQACVDGRCGSCTDSAQCCAPLLCLNSTCTLF